MNSCQRFPLTAFLVGVALLASPGLAADRTIDLAEPYGGIEMVGGYKVAGGGDVNGDGRADVAVSRGGLTQEPTSGRTYVVFGQTEQKHIQLDNLGDGGFVIEGAKPDDIASRPAIVPDVNGDGLDDIVVGAPGTDNNGRLESGTAYVVFGKSSSDKVNLIQFDTLTQGTQGFRIDGSKELAIAGENVAGIGDMNSDGLGDILVSAPFAGASYVVFGKTSMLPIDLSTFHNSSQAEAGFLIKTPRPGSNERYNAESVQDVNGDGVPDVMVAVRMGHPENGGAWVVFGKDTPAAVDVTDLGRGGFRVALTAGPEMDGIGDVNGDGLDDIVFAHPLSVIFGKRGSKTVRPSELGNQGYRIKIGQNSSAGQSLSGLGDVNNDSIPDFLVSVPAAARNGRSASGSVYVVFGKVSSRPLRLWELGRHGYRIDGASPDDYLGESVAGAGDVNADGVPDILIGSSGAAQGEGTSYLLWGGTQ